MDNESFKNSVEQIIRLHADHPEAKRATDELFKTFPLITAEEFVEKISRDAWKKYETGFPLATYQLFAFLTAIARRMSCIFYAVLFFPRNKQFLTILIVWKSSINHLLQGSLNLKFRMDAYKGDINS